MRETQVLHKKNLDITQNLRYYRQKSPNITDHHIQLLKDSGVIWAHYPPNTDLTHVQFLQDCSRIRLYITLFGGTGYQVPHKYVCPITATRVGSWIKRIKDQWKANQKQGKSFPDHRLQALKAIGLDPTTYFKLKHDHTVSFHRIHILSSIRKHKAEGLPGFHKIQFNKTDTQNMDHYDRTGKIMSDKLNPDFYSILESLENGEEKKTDDPIDPFGDEMDGSFLLVSPSDIPP